MAMACFRLSISSIGFVIGLCSDVFTASKDAGSDFRAVTTDIDSLHRALRKLYDEADNASSLIHRTPPKYQEEIQSLMTECKADLLELDQYMKECTKANRLRDKLKLGSKRQSELLSRLSKHCDTINWLVEQSHTGSLGRIEMSQEEQAWSMKQIMAKLESIHQDVRWGKSRDSTLTGNDGLGSLDPMPKMTSSKERMQTSDSHQTQHLDDAPPYTPPASNEPLRSHTISPLSYENHENPNAEPGGWKAARTIKINQQEHPCQTESLKRGSPTYLEATTPTKTTHKSGDPPLQLEPNHPRKEKLKNKTFTSSSSNTPDLSPFLGPKRRTKPTTECTQLDLKGLLEQIGRNITIQSSAFEKAQRLDQRYKSREVVMKFVADDSQFLPAPRPRRSAHLPSIESRLSPEVVSDFPLPSSSFRSLTTSPTFEAGSANQMPLSQRPPSPPLSVMSSMSAPAAPTSLHPTQASRGDIITDEDQVLFPGRSRRASVALGQELSPASVSGRGTTSRRMNRHPHRGASINGGNKLRTPYSSPPGSPIGPAATIPASLISGSTVASLQTVQDTRSPRRPRSTANPRRPCFADDISLPLSPISPNLPTSTRRIQGQSVVSRRNHCRKAICRNRAVLDNPFYDQSEANLVFG